MKTFYADDTYLKSAKDDPVPRIHIFGGIIIDHSCEAALTARIRKIKERYTHPNMPIKWNLKDSSIKSVYEKWGRLDEYDALIKDSYTLRKDIATAISESEVRILVSCIEAYSDDREIIKDKKPELLRFLFENTLLQLAFDASADPDRWACVLDWPPGSEALPFDQAYYHLFHEGTTPSGVKSMKGALEPLGFAHSPFYARCNHSPLLQLADIIIGATREHIESVMQERASCLGSEVVGIFKKKFRTDSMGRITGYGVVPSGGNHRLKAHVQKAFQ